MREGWIALLVLVGLLVLALVLCSLDTPRDDCCKRTVDGTVMVFCRSDGVAVYDQYCEGNQE